VYGIRVNLKCAFDQRRAVQLDELNVTRRFTNPHRAAISILMVRKARSRVRVGYIIDAEMDQRDTNEIDRDQEDHSFHAQIK